MEIKQAWLDELLTNLRKTYPTEVLHIGFFFDGKLEAVLDSTGNLINKDMIQENVAATKAKAATAGR